MHSIDQMNKELTHLEFENAREIFTMAREQGFGTLKAVGIAYRAGRLAGKKEIKERQGQYIKRQREIIQSLKEKLPGDAAEATPPEDVTIEPEDDAALHCPPIDEEEDTIHE